MNKRRRSRTKEKGKPSSVRVIAARHPPTESTSPEALAAMSPYVADQGYGEFFHAIAALMPADEDLARANTDELKALGERILKFILEREPRVADAEIPIFVAALLSLCGEKIHQGIYRGTERNPVYAMEAFTTFHRQGLYPPLWVLNWLNDAFLAYLESGGTKSLQSLLGVTRLKGQTPVFKEANAVTAETRMMREIGGLTLLGISIEDAAFMVEQRMLAKKTKCLSAETLAARFTKKGWSRIAKVTKVAAISITPDIKEKLRAAYPKDAIPQKYR